MKPQLLKVSTGPLQSFSVRRDTIPNINSHWHYHPELELIHFKKGEGTQFIGDDIRRFQDGDVILIGAGLPHYWRFDDVNSGESVYDIRVAHFTETFWGKEFLNLPENAGLKAILEKAKRGISISGPTKELIAGLLDKMLVAEGSKRLLLLIDALTSIASSTNLSFLSSFGFLPAYAESDNERINKIYEFSLQNFKRKIELKEVADIAAMSENSFCRYFKSRTRKTYSTFIIEIKIGHACKLLIENKLTIKQICTESGFYNVSGFYRYFKLVTGKSPLEYQNQFIRT